MPRLNKRAQREQQELSTLQDVSQTPDPASDAESSEPEVVVTKPKLGFAALGMNDDRETESDQDDGPSQTSQKSKSKKKKKKPKKAAAEKPPVSEAPSTSAPTPSSSVDPTMSRKAKKRAKKGEQVDEFELALQQLSMSGNTKAGGTSGGLSSEHKSVSDFYRLLATDPKMLDSDAELRRFFGSKVVNSAKASAGGKQRRTPVRSQLTTPPPTWPMVRLAQGLSIRSLEAPEIHRKVGAYEGDKWWTIEHSPSYKGIELAFLETVAMGDYQGFMNILQRHPWHVDSLLQMSEVARHQEDNTQASDLVARALFAIERAFSPAFNLTTGTQRLDFDRIENRPFFLALARYVVNLQKRGTNRTAFEFAKLLYSLDPGSDPHGALLYLDFLAVRCGMNEWIVDLFKLFAEQEIRKEPNAADPRVLPGWWYSRALAVRNIEERKGDHTHQESTTLLREAMVAFPHVLPVLADKAGINLSGAARAHPALRIETGYDGYARGDSALHLLSHIYAQRSFELWKIPEVTEWVQSNVDSALLDELTKHGDTNAIRDRAKKVFNTHTPQSYVRHVIVAENRSVMAFFSPGAVPSEMVSYDPVPPRTSLSFYNEQYFGNVAERAMRRRGAAAAVDHDDDLAQAQMQQAIFDEIDRIRQQQGRGVVPGAMPGAHEGEVDSDLEEEETVDLIDEDSEDDDEDNEDVPAATGGFMQGLYNMLWRRQDGDPNAG